MLKTYIDVPRRDYIYYMVHDLITLDNGWDILTIVYKPNYVRFYFSYKWFQYGKVRAFKKKARNYAKQVTYYDRVYCPKLFIAQRDKLFLENCAKAIAVFANAGIQGNPESKDDKTTVNKEKLKWAF